MESLLILNQLLIKFYHSNLIPEFPDCDLMCTVCVQGSDQVYDVYVFLSCRKSVTQSFISWRGSHDSLAKLGTRE
jgi:hypothetical protein